MSFEHYRLSDWRRQHLPSSYCELVVLLVLDYASIGSRQGGEVTLHCHRTYHSDIIMAPHPVQITDYLVVWIIPLWSEQAQMMYVSESMLTSTLALVDME